MVQGKFLKTIKHLNYSWGTILHTHSNKYLYLNWYFFYHTLKLTKFVPERNSSVNNQYTLNCAIRNFFRKTQSIFFLYIYKVSKGIHKNTRGKSGKYMFLWKYVPTYKRLPITFTWLIKEMRMSTQRKLHLRILQTLINMSHNPLETWPYRIKLFTYNYVYQNCKKTLATNYLSVKV